jgi:hypothetical protein
MNQKSEETVLVSKLRIEGKGFSFHFSGVGSPKKRDTHTSPEVKVALQRTRQHGSIKTYHSL